MATPFSSIFKRFSRKVTDYSLGNLIETEAEEVLIGYLQSAAPKFLQCNTNLTRDDINKQFNNTLTELEEEILAVMMLKEWIDPYIKHSNFMEQTLGSKDFQLYSPANQLKEMRETEKTIEEEIDSLIIRYCYSGDLSNLA